MNTTRGYIALLIGMLGYVSLGIAVRGIIAGGLTPVQSVLARAGMAVLMMMIMMTIFDSGRLRRMIKAPLEDIGLLMFKGLFGFGISASLFSYAIVHTTYFNASVMYTIPFVSLLGMLFNNDRLTWKSFAILGMSVVGMFLVLVKNIQTFTFGVGELAATGAALFLSLSMVSRKWFTDYLTSQEVTLGVAFFGMIIVYIISIFQGTTSLGASLFGMPFSELPRGYMVLGGVLLSFSGIFNNYGMKHVSDIHANVLMNTEVVIGLFISVFLYHETVSTQEGWGGALILVSSMLLILLAKKK